LNQRLEIQHLIISLFILWDDISNNPSFILFFRGYNIALWGWEIGNLNPSSLPLSHHTSKQIIKFCVSSSFRFPWAGGWDHYGAWLNVFSFVLYYLSLG
jgi:hypothetical protein